MGSPGIGVSGAKNDLRNSLDKFEDFNYVIEDLIGSEAYPDLVGTYWKGTLTPKAASSGAEHFFLKDEIKPSFVAGFMVAFIFSNVKLGVTFCWSPKEDEIFEYYT